jgi:DnaJ-class molecular chaperone
MSKAQPDTGEIKCEACDGRGSPPPKEPAPGRRIYSGRCQMCGGKGRLTKPGKSESSAATRVPR